MATGQAPDMGAPGLIFCIGAAKSGTSWLHDTLADHDEVHLRRVKELHYFDTLEPGFGRWQYKQLQREADEMRARLAAGRGNPAHLVPKLADLDAWLASFDGKTPDDAAYLAYLDAGRAPGARLMGDFTPAYGLLSTSTFQRMAALADKVRFVFLMRDPVERVWSNIRMNARRAGPGRESEVLARELDGFLARDNAKVQARADYKGTLTRLLAAVPRRMVHLEFYERLFSAEAMDRLARFLGIGPIRAAFGRKVHAGRPVEMPAGTRDALAGELQAQYTYVSDLMGGLPDQWTDRMVRV